LLGHNDLADSIESYLVTVFSAASVPTNIETRRVQMQAFFGTVPFNFDDDPEHLEQLQLMPDPDQVTDVFYAVEQSLVESTISWAAANQGYFQR
jgi:hypothetical protein